MPKICQVGDSPPIPGDLDAGQDEPASAVGSKIEVPGLIQKEMCGIHPRIATPPRAATTLTP